MKRCKRLILPIIMILVMAGISSHGEVIDLPIDFSGGTKLGVKYSKDIQVYEDPTIRVERQRVESKEWGCTYYVCYITLNSAAQLRTSSANGFDSNSRDNAEAMAKRVNAVLAVNGDYFSGRTGNYVLRQGIVYRDSLDAGQDMLLIDEGGDFHIILADEHPQDMDLTQIDGKKVINAICFGPALVKDGEKVLDLKAQQKNSKGHERAQRICIAQTGPLQYMVVACAHYGLTTNDLCDLAMSLGDVQQCYNLDGGNSTYLMFLGHKINNTEAGSPRLVSDIIYFCSAWTEDQ